MISILLNVIILLIFICFLFKMIKELKGYCCILILHMFFTIWLLMSVAYIETGIYNRNLDMITSFNFSTLRLWIYEFTFFLTILIWAKKTNIRSYDKKIKKIKASKNSVNISNTIVLIINCLFIFNAIISGNVLTDSNITRFNFYESYSQMGFVRPLFYLINPLSCLMGLNFIYSSNKKAKYLSIINLFLSLLYAFLTGNEFGVLLYIVFYFFLPIAIYLVNSIEDKRQWTKLFFAKYKKFILFSMVAFLFVILIKINSFNKVNVFSEITTSPLGAFLYRAFGLQGDTWWGTDRLVMAGYNDIGQIRNELIAFFNDSMKYNAGIQYLMKLILPQNSLNRYIWGGAELMSGYPAINIVMYGYIGTFFMVIIDATLFFLLTSYAYKKILKKQYLRVFFSIVLLDQTMKVIGIGGIWYLGNTIPIISISMICIIEFTNLTIGSKIIKYRNLEE